MSPPRSTSLWPPPSLRAQGRGARYTPLRGLAELCLHHAYRGDWPARAWARTRAAGRVDRVTVDLAIGLGSPLTLAFASDLHLGPTTAARTLDAAFEALAEARPDVLALGGDYVFLEATREKARELRDRVEAVPAPIKIAVMGNHDLWTFHPRLEDALREAGARVLVNDAARLPAPHHDVAILGLDDPLAGAPDADRAARAAHGAGIRLALCHAPEGAPLLAGHGVSLLLAGHTHGGHIALPGPRPLIIPGPLGKRFPHGRHRLGAMELVVSRGVGGVEVPVRAHAPPDVVIVRLT